MSTHVVVNSLNKWLWYGKAATAQEAFDQAKGVTDFSQEETTYVYEVASEAEFTGIDSGKKEMRLDEG